ncbi:hypothetical protein CDD80_7132 [Ophiocordyceps camponoti-rufipedis]|uniref:Retrovirus-related Pol polyprotein from transposon TNT 1-94-like beta-barrel domain-containing protein n=1 Tax=Ophiocordyceps camponoti-rufipedis TaxID=2004952 RepID=A0A2C5XRC8_9HYPO|nr:hypothetical protein CDD80_7132 [Ophiocordyceps camponoti-rufipedis]
MPKRKIEEAEDDKKSVPFDKTQGSMGDKPSDMDEPPDRDRVLLCSTSRHHMFNDLKWFADFVRYDEPGKIVKTAHGARIRAFGLGTVKVYSVSNHYQLKEAFYVPSMPVNFISHGLMAKEGFTTLRTKFSTPYLSRNDQLDFVLDWHLNEMVMPTAKHYNQYKIGLPSG